MQVKKNTLLLLACLVWTAAGVNILRIGLLAYATQVSLPHILLSLLVFFLFQVFVFGRLAPDPFLAVFYSGLGAALLLAGLLFGRNYGRALRAARP